MKKEDINLLYIYHRMSLDTYGIIIPYENSSNIDDVNKIIGENKGHRIILVGKVEDIQELKDSINLDYIHKIFILGDGTKLNIDSEVISVNENEVVLMLKIILATKNYAHDEYMQQKELGRKDVANKLANYIIQLTDQLNEFYVNHLQ